MSFFEDDFYSTKVSDKLRRYPLPPWRKRQTKQLLSVAAVSFIAGVLLTMLVFPLFGEEHAVPATNSAPPDGERDSVVLAAETVQPAVVSVVSGLEDTDVPFHDGIGSGIIFRKDGDDAWIVTNNHVVANAERIEVILSDGVKKKAKIVGKDTFSDLAVLKVKAPEVKRVAEFGDSDRLKAGETAIAIGSPLGLGFSQTITVGVISSTRRTIPISLNQDGQLDWELNVIQTDAAINQGNSGGALVNIRGQVIGINSLKVADMGVEGLGFAIPINDAKPIIESLMADGKVKRPYIGVVTQDLQSYQGTEVLKLPKQVKTGIIVLEVMGPAKEAGLRTNDVIVALDDKAVDSTLALRKYLYSHKAIGDEMKVTFYRNGKKDAVTVTLEELNED